MYFSTDTIIALATPPGVSAIAVIRISGTQAIHLIEKSFKGKKLSAQSTHTLHFGTIQDEENILLDEVLVAIFKAPHSFTKEESIEISCHGSPYITQQIMQLLLRNGARMAKPGEFTQRAFLNGRFDLAQAEAVADLIASDSKAAHQMAMNQMRGGFSKKITALREQLIHFAAMIELELDFAEEDVEFANRDELRKLVLALLQVVTDLLKSFDAGNVIKSGIPIAIVGKPNVGKSTLLNTLLQEEKAIVSDIPGTTRDTIEDELTIEGVKFRLIDTAGLRTTTDKIEAMGVARAKEKLKQATIILYVFDTSLTTTQELQEEVEKLEVQNNSILLVGNKVDKANSAQLEILKNTNLDHLFISAEKQLYIEELKQNLLNRVKEFTSQEGNIVSNARHYACLLQTQQALQAVIQGLAQNITSDFIALDIKNAIHHLGEITGEITSEDLLGHIFSKFCIGK